MSILTVLPDGERVRVKPGETILAALSAAGFGYRVGCRRGGCGVCKVTLREGSVHYDHAVCQSVLSEDELAGGTVLTCRAVPDGNVTIELRDERLRIKSSFLRSLRAVPPATTATKE